jgi:hypothetical protein
MRRTGYIYRQCREINLNGQRARRVRRHPVTFTMLCFPTLVALLYKTTIGRPSSLFFCRIQCSPGARSFTLSQVPFAHQQVCVARAATNLISRLAPLAGSTVEVGVTTILEEMTAMRPSSLSPTARNLKETWYVYLESS